MLGRRITSQLASSTMMVFKNLMPWRSFPQSLRSASSLDRLLVDAKAALEAQCYVFTEALTAAEEELFGYVNNNYLLFNPGTEDNSFKSYVGVYYSDTGETT